MTSEGGTNSPSCVTYSVAHFDPFRSFNHGDQCRTQRALPNCACSLSAQLPITSRPNGDVKATLRWFPIDVDHPRPLFAFADISRRYNRPEVYSFLTTVEAIDHERMPELLTTEDEFATWLNGTPTEAMVLARQELWRGCLRMIAHTYVSLTTLMVKRSFAVSLHRL